MSQATGLPARVNTPAGYEPIARYPWRRTVREPRDFSPLPLVEGGRWAAAGLLSFDGLAFVTNSYRAVLARDPDPAGLYRMLVHLEDGWPKALLLARLRFSADGRRSGARITGLAWPLAKAAAESVATHGVFGLARMGARNAAWLFRKAASHGIVPFFGRSKPETPSPAATHAPVSTPPAQGPAPLLSICVTTYNRAPWLVHSLPALLKQAAPYKGSVEVLLCDNASGDATPDVAEKYRGAPAFQYHRNAKNCGMLGNLSVCAEKARGRYVWVIGDDDLLVEGALARILAAIERHPESELFYLNYACTEFDQPENLRDIDSVIRDAQPVSTEFADQPAEAIREISTKTENCFTGIYCLIYRADHARRAYAVRPPEPPFSSLASCVPTADYVCREMFGRPGYWVGDPCVVVNRNVSWMRYAALYSLERFPELFELMQANGADAEGLDRLRTQHVPKAMHWLGQIYFGGQRRNLPLFSVETLVRRYGHLPAFRRRWAGFRKVYSFAWTLGLAGKAAPAPRALEEALRR